ncbi:MAG: nicotinic acid mononucleotide adenylyltransferase, partial [Novosphingobium sp.]|nr:nicotinic acid mononucleotide adenylyltransferase [Novosphingobium sp.]
PVSSLRGPERWSAPALVTLRFDPDTRSATAIRRADPDWARTIGTRPARTLSLRDAVTHRIIPGTAA